MNFLSEMGEGMQLPVIQNEHVKILIGPENVVEELKDSSVIMASYNIGGGMQGSSAWWAHPHGLCKITARLSYLAEGLSRCSARGSCPRAGTTRNRR